MSTAWPRSHTLNRRLCETPEIVSILNDSEDSDDENAHRHHRHNECVRFLASPTNCQAKRNYGACTIPRSISSTLHQMHSLPTNVGRRLSSTCVRFKRMPATLLRHGLTYLAGTTTSSTSTTTATAAAMTTSTTAMLQTTTVIITSASSVRLIECAVLLTLLFVLCVCGLGVNVLAALWRFWVRRVWRNSRLWSGGRCCVDCDRGPPLWRRPIRKPTLFSDWDVTRRRRRKAMGTNNFDGVNLR